MFQKIPFINRKSAVIIGNGTTRQNFNLNNLVNKENLLIYSCGVAYKGFDDPNKVDYHVTIEEYRRDQLEKEDQSPRIYPEDIEDHVESMFYHGHAGPRPRSNTGMFAMKCAIRTGCSVLYILGFDSLIKNDETQSISNMFKGKAETRTRAADNPNRIRYLDWFMSHNHLVDFIFVFDKQYEFYRCQSNNMHGLSYSMFEKMLTDDISF